MSREFEIRREVALPATPDQVRAAVSTPEGLAGWFMPMDIHATPGAEVEESPGRLAVRVGTDAFEYLIEGRDGSTVLRFVHSGMLGDDWSDEFEGMTAAGWSMYLHTLGQYLGHFADRPTLYAEADAPADPAVWPGVLAAVTASAVGEPVHLELGDRALDGEIDYLTESFVGFRTADALVRFHERSAIGMPVAVSHHHFGAGESAEALGDAWRAWFAGL
ncbi:MAG: SRPBCC domain-containing protein [Pseudonocardia sp.]|nr:SRPBCC domain-containing protein [Pseudonocardia sp.]